MGAAPPRDLLVQQAGGGPVTAVPGLRTLMRAGVRRSVATEYT
jgi:hypothetical protein